MKERPILFSTPMVKAILAGNKTQTRRVVKPQPVEMIAKLPMPLKDFTAELELITKTGRTKVHTSGSGKGLIFPDCPYGQPGDVLWVREKIMIDIGGGIHYCASEKYSKIDRWKPSIHMPKAAARIWLQIESIRVERLQDISEEDAQAEGVDKDYYGFGRGQKPKDRIPNYKHGFISTWSKINGFDSWQENPWVWAITFKVLSTTGKPSNL